MFLFIKKFLYGIFFFSTIIYLMRLHFNIYYYHRPPLSNKHPAPRFPFVDYNKKKSCSPSGFSVLSYEYLPSCAETGR